MDDVAYAAKFYYQDAHLQSVGSGQWAVSSEQWPVVSDQWPVNLDFGDG